MVKNLKTIEIDHDAYSRRNKKNKRQPLIGLIKDHLEGLDQKKIREVGLFNPGKQSHAHQSK